MRAGTVYRRRRISFYTSEIKRKHQNLSPDASDKAASKTQWSMERKTCPSFRTNPDVHYSHRVANKGANVTDTHSWDSSG